MAAGGGPGTVREGLGQINRGQRVIFGTEKKKEFSPRTLQGDETKVFHKMHKAKPKPESFVFSNHL